MAEKVFYLNTDFWNSSLAKELLNKKNGSELVVILFELLLQLKETETGNLVFAEDDDIVEKIATTFKHGRATVARLITFLCENDLAEIQDGKLVVYENYLWRVDND